MSYYATVKQELDLTTYEKQGKWAIWESRRACNFTGVAAWNAYAKYLKIETKGIKA